MAALKELGAVPFCLTNVPQTMVIEITNIKMIMTTTPYFITIMPHIVVMQMITLRTVPKVQDCEKDESESDGPFD